MIDHANINLSTIINNLHKLIFIILIIIYVGLRFHNLFEHGLWLDEVFSLETANGSWNDLISKVIQDVVHPPLFYVILKIWIMLFGSSLLSIKLLPFVISILTIVPFLGVCNKLHLTANEKVIAFLVITNNAYLIFYSQELRMYSLFLLLSLCSIWTLLKYLESDTNQKEFLNFCLWILVSVLMVYTHYFGLLTISAEILFVVIWHRSKCKSLFIGIGSVALLFLPWAIFVLISLLNKGGLSQNLSWIPKPGISDIAHFFSQLLGILPLPKATTLAVLFFVIPVGLWFLNIIRNKNREDHPLFGILFLLTLLPIIVAFIVSHLLTNSIWSDRYLIATAIPYSILITVSILRVNYEHFGRLLLILLICTTITSCIWLQFFTQNRTNWTNIASIIETQKVVEGEERRIFVFEGWTQLPLEFITADKNFLTARTELITYSDLPSDQNYMILYRESTFKNNEVNLNKLLENCSQSKSVVDRSVIDEIHLVSVKCK